MEDNNETEKKRSKEVICYSNYIIKYSFNSK